MAVTTPGLFQPDSLTVTISQVPGVSSPWRAAELRHGSIPGLLPLPHFLLFAFRGTPQQQASLTTKSCYTPQRTADERQPNRGFLQPFPVP